MCGSALCDKVNYETKNLRKWVTHFLLIFGFCGDGSQSISDGGASFPL